MVVAEGVNVLGTFFGVDPASWPPVLYWTKNNHFYKADSNSGFVGNPTYGGYLLFASTDCTCSGNRCDNAYVVANPSDARDETPVFSIPTSPFSVLLNGRDPETGRLLTVELFDSGVTTIRSQGFGPGDCYAYPPPPDRPPVVGVYVVHVSVSDLTSTRLSHPLTVRPAP